MVGESVGKCSGGDKAESGQAFPVEKRMASYA